MNVSGDFAHGLLEAVPDALLVVDRSGAMVLVNRSAETLFGYHRRQLLGRSVEMLLPEDARARHHDLRLGFFHAPTQRPMGGGQSFRALRADGTEFYAEIRLGPVPDGDARFVLATVRELTPYVRELQDSEARFRALIDQASESIFIADLNGRYTHVNAAACELLDFSREELQGKTILDIIPGEDASRLADTREALLVPGAVSVEEWNLVRRDGTTVPVEVSAKILPDGRWQAFVRDISGRRRSEQTTRRTLHELENVLETMPDPVAIVMDERYVWVNSALGRVLDIPTKDLVGRHLYETIHVDDRASLKARLEDETSGAAVGEVRFIGGEGSTIPLLVQRPARVSYGGQPATLIAAHDDRALKRLQLDLAARDRLVTVGTLAAGVGHEINNPLLYVMMNLDLASEELEAVAGGSPSARLRDILGMMKEAKEGAERIRRIVRGLNTFARPEKEVRAEVDLRSVLDVSLNLAWNELRHRVQVVKEYRAVPPVFVDESRLAQVFINLLVNGVHAMGDRALEQNVIRVNTRTDDRGHAVVEICDNGSGMSPDVADRVFEPFYTTKPVGKGTGLGLSIAHNIISSAGGDLTCETQLGAGTCFRITLPPYAGQEVAAASSAVVTSEPPRSRLLIVDDEPAVAASIARALGTEHDVQVVCDAGEALRRLLGGEHFDVILCDVMMPGVGGQEFFERLREARSELAERVVFITGGATNRLAQRFLDTISNERLDKPFDLTALRAVVARVTA